MRMWIDKSWKNILPARVNDLSPRRDGEILSNTGDGFTFAEDVSDVTFCGGNYLAVFDEQRHGLYGLAKAADCWTKRSAFHS